MRHNLFLKYVFHVFIGGRIIIDSSEFVNIVSYNFVALICINHIVLFNWISYDLHYTFEFFKLIAVEICDVFLAYTVEYLEICLEAKAAHKNDKGDIFVDVFNFTHDVRFSFVVFYN